MAPIQHDEGESHLHKRTDLTESLHSGSTAVQPTFASEQDVDATKHATILDIDPDTRIPRDGMVFRKPTVDDLLRQGPSQIMSGIKGHRPRLRWIHLRSNCMSWVEGLMDKVVQEKRIPNPPTKVNPLLRKDLWAHLFHGKASDRIQSRFMGPACTQFSVNLDDEHSDSSDGSHGLRENLVLYLPYLNWESFQAWQERQQLIHNISTGRPCKLQADSELIEKHLHHKTSPLHDRRTLHQAFYHSFGMTRSLPEYNQVMQRFTSEIASEAEAKLLVVDQLWLWVIRGVEPIGEDGDDTSIPDLVITAFPGRFNGLYDSADVYHGIIQHIERGLEPPLKNVNDLVAVIVEHCTGVFFQRQLEPDKWFVEFFAAAIGIIRNKSKLVFDKFCVSTQHLEDLQSSQASLLEISRKLEDSSFSISAETELFRDVKDIIHELGCIDYILARQGDVIQSLTRQRKSRSLKLVGEIVQQRRDTWTAIAEAARSAYNEIQAQMDLKQKQSSLAEARTNRYQVEDSTRHGRIMLLFTVVTIIFLPMSFLASWFGMNIKGRTNSAQLGLGVIAALIFPISIIIAIVALAFAFSQRLRDQFASWMERIIDGIMRVLPLHGSSGERPTRFDRRRSRDRMRPPRFDVRLRRLTETQLESESLPTEDQYADGMA